MLTGVDAPEEKVIAFKNNLKLADQLIGDQKYVTGDELTIADLSLLAITSMLHIFQFDVTDYPNFKRWLSSIKSELPYYAEINEFEPAYLQQLMDKYAKQKQTQNQ